MKKVLFGIFIVIIIAGIGGLFLWRSGNLPFQQDTIYIAVAGPMSGPYQAESQAMLQGIRLYLERLRKKGGLPGKNIELLLYDDQDDPQRAEAAASQIARDNKALMVLGHSHGSTSRAAGAIYKKHEIPAITASALTGEITRDNEWYFRIVPHNALQANFIAYYIKYSLQKTSVSIIFVEDEYGHSLLKHFETTAQTLGLHILNRWSIQDEPTEEQQSRLQEIVTELSTTDTPPEVIFFATYSKETVNMITSLRQTEREYLFIGAADVASKWFLQDFNAYAAAEHASPGLYSDGVYGTSPFLAEVAGEQAYEFVREFERRYHKPPAWYEAYYYDAMHVAVEAIRRAELQGAGYIYSDRKRLKEALMRFYNQDTALEGVTGEIFFDEHGDVIRPYAIGFYQNQRFIPAYTQYHQIPEPEDRGDLFAKVQQGDIILLNGRFMDKRMIVHTGIKIHELCQIDVENSTYTVDFSIWFRFQEDFHDARITLQNTVGTVKLGKPVFEAHENDITIRMYRVKATFQDQFDFTRYPVDRHELRIGFRHAELPLEKLGYVPDKMEPPQTLSDPTEKDRQICCPGNWKLTDISSYQDSLYKATTFGLPKYFEKPHKVQYSQFHSVIRIERQDLSGFITRAIPMLVLIGCVFMLHLLPARWFGVRILLCVIALLTNMYYHHQFMAGFSTEYLTLFEYVILIAYGLIFLSMLMSFSKYGFYKRRLALVQGIHLFEPLSDKLKLALSKKMRRQRVRKPEKVIFRQGEQGESLFVILNGEVSLRKEHADGTSRELTRRTTGGFIGEMALLKGETRPVSAISATPAFLGEITKADLLAVLKKYPDILDQMKQKAEQRRQETTEVREEMAI